MRQATMTIIGLYNWDESLFDGLHLPEQISKDDFIDELLSMAGGQNVLYPDFDLMKRLITTWSGRRISAWQRIATALNSEYNPIHNYDRTEEYEDIHDLTYTSKQVRDLRQQAESNSSETVASFDSATLQPRTGANTGGSSSDTGTVDNTQTDKGTIKHEAHLFGNIGVTTTQEMIEAEIGLRKTDLIELIIGEFIGRFCLDVYN